MAKLQIGNFETALKSYYVDVRAYPKTEDGLNALIKPPSDENQAKKWDQGYLDDDVIPADPWGNAYIYEYVGAQDGAKDFPRIRSAGPDSQPNTEDDIINWRESSDGGGDAATNLDGGATGIDAIDSSTQSN